MIKEPESGEVRSSLVGISKNYKEAKREFDPEAFKQEMLDLIDQKISDALSNMKQEEITIEEIINIVEEHIHRHVTVISTPYKAGDGISISGRTISSTLDQC